MWVKLEREEKMDSITLEYTYLLTNQLESQRIYFEEKLANIEKMAQEQVPTRLSSIVDNSSFLSTTVKI